MISRRKHILELLDRKPALKKTLKPSAKLLCRFEPVSRLTAQAVSTEQLLALGSEDGHLFVVNLKYSRLALDRHPLLDRPDAVWRPAESKTNCIRWLDSSSLALAQTDGSLVLADAHRFSATTAADFHADSILGIEACPEEPSLLLSWALDRSLKLFDLREGLGRHVVHRLSLQHDGHFTGAVFANSARCFVTAEAASRSLSLWDLRQLPQKKSLGRPATSQRLSLPTTSSICEKRCDFDAHSHLSSVVEQLEREVLHSRLESDRLHSILSTIDDIDRRLLADTDAGPPGVASLHATASTLVACHRSGRLEVFPLDRLTAQQPKVFEPLEHRPSALGRPPVVCTSPCGAFIFRATDSLATEILDVEARCPTPLGRELSAAELKTAAWAAEPQSYLCLLSARGSFDCYHVDL